MGNFFSHWFRGFGEALDELSTKDKEALFRNCGRACSDSYSRKMYVEAFERSGSLEEFIKELKARFDEMDIRIIEDGDSAGKKVEIIYNFCACDLVRQGYVNSPELCECSRQSLLYNWGVFEDKEVTVKREASILGGDSHCKFIVTLADRG